MKQKTKPISPQSIHQKEGITFSFQLSYKATDKYTFVPLSPPASPVSTKSDSVGEFLLEPTVLQVTSHILKQRLKSVSPTPTDPPSSDSSTDSLALKFHINREKGVGRKRKSSYPASDIHCSWCQSNKTSQWRRGPKGPRSLCNVF